MNTKKFHMATLKDVKLSLRDGDWAVSLDLKDAYLHVPIQRRQFLRFCYKGSGYQFRYVPFDLSMAPMLSQD